MSIRIITGDCVEQMRALPAASVQCCVTSPPYWGLRDYGVSGQLGLETTPEEYVAKMVAVFREVRRVLRDDGTLWLNIGDSYAATSRSSGASMASTLATRPTAAKTAAQREMGARATQIPIGLKPKDLVGIPWRVAFALQADGWYLRSDIIWHKPNPMPESVTDRPTKAHEYVFLLTKSERYFYDAEAIAEPVAASSVARLSQPTLATQIGSARVPGKTNGNMKAVGEVTDRNARTVWSVTTQPFSEAHFATMPPALAERCVRAGSKEGDVVLDPFGGAGTTGLVAQRLNRSAILCELNPEYVAIAEARIRGDSPMFSKVEVL